MPESIGVGGAGRFGAAQTTNGCVGRETAQGVIQSGIGGALQQDDLRIEDRREMRQRFEIAVQEKPPRLLRCGDLCFDFFGHRAVRCGDQNSRGDHRLLQVLFMGTGEQKARLAQGGVGRYKFGPCIDNLTPCIQSETLGGAPASGA